MEGPITIARAPAIAASTSAAGFRLLGAAELEALDDALGPLADHELLEGTPAGGCADPGADGVIAHRQHARAYADRLVQARERRRRSEVVVLTQPHTLQTPREVAVAEVEPHVAAERAQRVHHRERVLAQAPAALHRSDRPARRRRGPGRGRRARRRSRCHRPCSRSPRDARDPRRRRACPARASRRRCRRRARRRRCSIATLTPRARRAGPPAESRRGPCSGS